MLVNLATWGWSSWKRGTGKNYGVHLIKRGWPRIPKAYQVPLNCHMLPEFFWWAWWTGRLCGSFMLKKEVDGGFTMFQASVLTITDPPSWNEYPNERCHGMSVQMFQLLGLTQTNSGKNGGGCWPSCKTLKVLRLWQNRRQRPGFCATWCKVSHQGLHSLH